MKYIIGIDEVGRAAWAGPLTVGAAALPVENTPDWVKDIKELNDERRERQFTKITKLDGLIYKVIHSKVYKTNLNLNTATIDAAIRGLQWIKEHLTNADTVLLVVMDNVSGKRHREKMQNAVQELFPEAKFIMEPNADKNYQIVAIASALAKHYRDTLMRRLDTIFFQGRWNWKSNKGYPDKHQLSIIKKEGFSTFHRKFMNYYNMKVAETHG